MQNQNIYVICPDSNDRHGGIKKLYRHVDVLNNNGFFAYILHKKIGFRCDWFENDTKIKYLSEVRINVYDYIVIPEVYGKNIADLFPGIPKVIFNQNAYYSFKQYSLDTNDLITPYNHVDSKAVLVVSNDNQKYLNYIFPDLKIHVIHNSIDTDKFIFTKNKRKLISLMTSKQPDDVTQLINILKFKGIFEKFELETIVNKTESQVADILKESLIFLWFTYQEGWPLPPAEAMACGSIVIGYHGFAGLECLDSDFSYPINPGDIITYAKTVEEVISLYEKSPEFLLSKGEKAAQYIKTHHSLEKEEEDIINAWNMILTNDQDQSKSITFDMSPMKVYNLGDQPIFSIILPVYNTPESYLIDAIESVLNQIYPHWELCIADDASTEPHVKTIIEHYAHIDSRIKLVFRTENGHISRSSNSALEIATGEFIALLDHDDLLTSDALYEVALLLNQHPDADMIYSDEDKVDDNNQFIFPTYKPDWCPDSFLSRMYTCHFGVYRRSIINEIGGFRVGYEGSQDYDLVLRFTEKTDKIFHIPKILYHWRLHAGSTSASTTAKSYAYEAGFKALTDALHRRGEKGEIVPDSNIPGHYHARYDIEIYKLVSIIIIVSNFDSKLDQCLESIFANTSYSNYEVIVINNGSVTSQADPTISKWQLQESNRFKYYFHEFCSNYSQLNNYAVTKVQGNYVLFLSSDIQIAQKDWLNAMVEQAQRESIGAVGVFLVDKNNSIQHVGLALGLGKIANPIYKGMMKIDEYETLANIALIKNVSAITGDCLMCRRDVFGSVGGFEEALPIIYNDVDLCLKMVAKGYRNIYLPHVKLIYQELKNLPTQITNEEHLQLEVVAVNFMQEKWQKTLEYDPCISPHIIKNINSHFSHFQKRSKKITKSRPQELEDNLNQFSQPLVSICIPTYNGEKFLAEALNSILVQTYPHIEIIISDDNSSDNTVYIANQFKQESSFDFSIFKHEQYGLAQNWNYCISQAKGKYIKFLFQDDILEPSCIEEMVYLAEQDEEIGLVFSPRQLFTNSENLRYDAKYLENHEAKDVHKYWSKLKPIQSGQELLQAPNILDNPINKIGEPSIVLVKKEVFDKVGLFNPELCQLVDLEMWLRIMSQYKIGYINQSLSRFRIHLQQQTRRNTALKDAIYLDYKKLFNIIANDSRYPQLTRQNAACRYAALSGNNTELYQLRKQIADQWLGVTDEQLADIYGGLLGNTHKMLLSSATKNHSLSQEEEIFLNDIATNISQGLQQPKAIQYLLISMLYGDFNQLLDHDFANIPEWVLFDYLQLLLSSQGYFQETGEAEKYCKDIEEITGSLHRFIFNNQNSYLYRKLTNYFAQLANFIPLYFTEKNLKDIYVKRAEILEALVKNNGSEVDYDFTDRPVNRNKIRLGILASNYLPSAETFAYLPVYEYLSRDFEVILYSLTEIGHRLEQYCQLSANAFKLLPQELSAQVDMIRADDVDILFVATNVTAVTNQICLLATHRLARVQVTSGGSVVTTGMRNMDYYISGTFTDPSPTAQEQYQEKLIKLEGSAHCFSYGTEEGKVTTPVDRNDLGIPEDAIVFISGANYFKIIPELIETWAKIISQVPNSVLVLLPFGPNWSNNYPKGQFIKHLQSIFTKYNLKTERLIVLDPQPVPDREDMKEYYKIADVYLDSFPFAGTTSLIEPLQVNIPVIARQGNCFRSAMGAAMIQTLNIPGLIADSEESYIELAVNLGNNSELRQQKSDEIQAAMNNHPSFLDSRAYSAKIETVFKELFRNYLAENLEQNLRLRDINFIIFPDWTQPEDELGFELQQVIQALATHPDNAKITLIICTANIANEDAEIFLSSVAMNLLMQDLDISDTIDISLVDTPGDVQWQSLLPRLNGRIILDHEDKIAMTQTPTRALHSYQLDRLISEM